MGQSYDIPEVVLTVDDTGRLLEVEIPDGVVVTIDGTETTTIYGPRRVEGPRVVPDDGE